MLEESPKERRSDPLARLLKRVLRQVERSRFFAALEVLLSRELIVVIVVVSRERTMRPPKSESRLERTDEAAPLSGSRSPGRTRSEGRERVEVQSYADRDKLPLGPPAVPPALGEAPRRRRGRKREREREDREGDRLQHVGCAAPAWRPPAHELTSSSSSGRGAHLWRWYSACARVEEGGSAPRASRGK